MSFNPLKPISTTDGGWARILAIDSLRLGYKAECPLVVEYEIKSPNKRAVGFFTKEGINENNAGSWAPYVEVIGYRYPDLTNIEKINEDNTR